MTEHDWPDDDGHHDGPGDDGHHDRSTYDGAEHDGAEHDAGSGHPGAHGAEPYPSWRDPHDVDAAPWEPDASWHQDDPGPPADHPGDDTGHDDTGADPLADTGGYAMGHVGADPDALPDVDDVPDLDAFAPPVHIGALPEPVDGFPWVDPAALGAAPAGAATPDGTGAEAPVDSTELAAYAGQDPQADWQHLAASDDPAVAALARFWRPAG